MRLGLLRAGGAISADLQSRHHNPEAAVFLHLALQFFENIADEFHDFAAPQARHVDMVAVQFALVIVSLAVDMHKVEFVDQSVPLEQLQGSIDRAAIDAGIQLLRLAQELGRIEVFGGRFDHPQNGPPLLGHPDPAVDEMSL